MRGNFVQAAPAMGPHLKNCRGDLTTLQDIMADGEKVENVILGGGEPGKYLPGNSLGRATGQLSSSAL
jgi:hypothetical protein